MILYMISYYVCYHLLHFIENAYYNKASCSEGSSDDDLDKLKCYMCTEPAIEHCLECRVDHWKCSGCSCEDWLATLKIQDKEGSSDDSGNDDEVISEGKLE